MTDKELDTSIQYLLGLPQFQDFLWYVIQTGRIFESVADGLNTRNLDHFEGRRGLVLEVLARCELAQPVPHPSGQPILTAIQTLLAQAQRRPTKNKGLKPYDRTAELNDEPDGDDGA